MDEATLSSNFESVLATLLKTNRPPTEQEKAIIFESMAPTNSKLNDVEIQISETMAHIQELKSQVEQAEIKLQRLQEEKASILETFADHRRIFSPFRNLPEDIIREICITCVKVDIPTLSYHVTPLPYVLAQICSGMRRIALTTPFLWASMMVDVDPMQYHFGRLDKQAYLILARKASEWLERAGGLPLTIVMEETETSGVRPTEFLSDILFETFLSYSASWNSIEFPPSSRYQPSSVPMARTAALTAADVPILESISLYLSSSGAIFYSSPILSVPTLKCLTLGWYGFPDSAAISELAVNWAILTSITIGGGGGHDCVCSLDAIAAVLRQTRCLVFCDITFDPRSGTSLGEINLPHLKTLCIDNRTLKPASFEAPSIFDLIKAPILFVLDIHAIFLDISLIEFFKHSTCIRELFLTHLNSENSFADITKFLRHCPSLYLLNLRPLKRSRMIDSYEGNKFLRAFVEDNGVGVVCPCLQNLNFVGAINFSLQTLQQFLEAKQRGITLLNGLVPWKRVMIDTREIWGTQTSQKLDLVSQKQAEGLDVYLYMRNENEYL